MQHFRLSNGQAVGYRSATSKTTGIEAAFAKLEAAQQVDLPFDLAQDMPFDPALIPRTIAALLGEPQDKMAHAQNLAIQAAQTTDEDFKALINTIQTALFGGDLSQLGQDLGGVYRQAWEAIRVGVETGGVDPQLNDR